MEEPKDKYAVCPVCEGERFIYQARNIYTGKITNVTYAEFANLPEDEVEARRSGEKVCADREMFCPVCDGWGYIENTNI